MSESGISTLLLDIEGTTTPIDFVYDVLFPYARTHARDFLAGHLESEEVQADKAGFLKEHSADVTQGFAPPALQMESEPAIVDSLVTYVHWLMDRDRKSTPLKSLQGRIWDEGYRIGELRSQVFD